MASEISFEGHPALVSRNFTHVPFPLGGMTRFTYNLLVASSRKIVGDDSKSDPAIMASRRCIQYRGWAKVKSQLMLI